MNVYVCSSGMLCVIYIFILAHCQPHRGFYNNNNNNNKGGRGSSYFFPEIDFLIVSDRGDQYLSDTFGPIKNIVPSRSYCWSKVSAYV